MTQMPCTPLLITTGDPAGIGMDIVLSCLSRHAFECPLVVVGCIKSLQARLDLLQKNTNKLLNIHLRATNYHHLTQFGQYHAPDCPIYVIDTPCLAPVVAGVPNAKNAMMVKNQLDIAHTLAKTGQVGAIVTAPLAKSVMVEGGVSLADGTLFSGHTEYFMQVCGQKKVVMMLANRTMKVALVTTHLPLKAVPAAITFEAVIDTLTITYYALKKQFAIAKPRLLVCGLNPHAGEQGHLGDEELTIINPAIDSLKKQGMDISYAMPADTLFTKHHLASADAVVAMYHDQGLAPLKSHGFGETVNITLGLPYIRTSVDHGTAFDLAGTGRASDDSLYHAMMMAIQMTKAPS